VSSATATPWLVVGLGNPGAEYARHRHNAGAMTLDELARRHGSRFRRHKTGADVIQTHLGDGRMILAKPRSFMNTSGGAVAALASFFSLPVSHVLVIHDELDIPFAELRLKTGGGSGGHNGLRSVASSLGEQGFSRLRVGIGRPPGRMDPADFVLRDFTAVERQEWPTVVSRAADTVEMVVREGVSATQNAAP
jgi:peptidyl-tRNA hydrolase, PTH1 family